MTYLSRLEFAKSEGVRPSYVTQLGNEGRLVLSDDGLMVDLERTRELIRHSADPAKQAVRARHAAARGRGAFVGDEAGDPVGESGTFIDAKTRHEQARAALAELDLRRRQGELLVARDVEAAQFEQARALRDALLAVPDRLAAVLAAEADPQTVHDLLVEEITAALVARAESIA